jgi:polar amino acid transport system substrate-binding protein
MKKGHSMSIKKMGGVAFTVALLVGLVAGCGTDNTTSNAPSEDCKPKAAFPTVTDGTLTVAVYVEPPYSTTGENGSMGGVDGEVINQIAADTCLAVKGMPMAGPAVFESLDAKRVDAAVGAISITDERKKLYGYAGPMYYTQMSYVSKDDVKTTAELDGKIIGVVAGYRWNEEYQSKFGDAVKVYQSNDGLLNDLVAGRVDVGLYDVGDIKYALDKLGKTEDFHVNVAPADPTLPTTESPGETVILLPKGSIEAADAMNAAIADMTKSGDLASFIEENGLPESSNIP